VGGGHGLELPYVKFKVTITDFAYKSGRQFEENIRHSTVIASYYFTTIDRVTIPQLADGRCTRGHRWKLTKAHSRCDARLYSISSLYEF